MKVRLIQPAQLDGEGKPTRYRQIFLPSGTLATLAALTPADVDVAVTDEYIDTIDFDEEMDLVGITALTPQAPRAYQVADEFRRRGRKVVMGGIHATALPEEALKHADAVVVGEAEDVWEKVVRDLQGSGRLESIYKSNSLPNLKRKVIPRFDLTNWDRCMKATFSKTPAIPVFTTRGCPFNCSFCSVTRFFGGKYRTKPIENVLEEISSSGARDFFFVDDNMAADEEYCKQLYGELAPLKIRWFSQVSTRVLEKPELVELAGDAGCHEVILGIESIVEENLGSVNKSFNKIDRYKELFSLLKDNGISANVSVIFGLDHDTRETCERTVDFLLENDINFIRISILTPYPGTKIHEKLESENRIFERDWTNYDLGHAVFHPAKMSAEDAVEAMWRGYDRFYSYSNIMRRLWKFKGFYFPPGGKCSFMDDLLFQLHFHISTGKKMDPYSGIP